MFGQSALSNKLNGYAPYHYDYSYSNDKKTDKTFVCFPFFNTIYSKTWITRSRTSTREMFELSSVRVIQFYVIRLLKWPLLQFLPFFLRYYHDIIKVATYILSKLTVFFCRVWIFLMPLQVPGYRGARSVWFIIQWRLFNIVSKCLRNAFFKQEKEMKNTLSFYNLSWHTNRFPT